MIAEALALLKSHATEIPTLFRLPLGSLNSYLLGDYRRKFVVILMA